MSELIFNIDQTALDTIKGLSIKANFEELKASLSEVVEPYKNVLVTEETVPVAKADRAKLRKVVTSLEDRRKLVKRVYMEPYDEFEEKCKELVAICNQGINNLDDQVKEFEQRAKKKKMLMLTEYFDTHNTFPQYLSIEDIANPKWVNVTYSIEVIQQEIDHAIEQTATDVDAIKAFESKHESLLLDEYKKTHNITDVLRLKKRIEDSEREAAAKEELRKQAEAKKQEEAVKEEPVAVQETPVVPRKSISELRDDDYVNCPCCGSSGYHVIYIRELNDEVVGCSDCIKAVDGYEYTQDVVERSYDEHLDQEIDEALGR